MPTDFNRLFRNLSSTGKRGSGQTYTGLYQAFGHCLQGGKVVYILCDTFRHVGYLRNAVYDMTFTLGVERVSGKNKTELLMRKGEHDFVFRFITESDYRQKLCGASRGAYVFQDTFISEEFYYTAKALL